MNDYLLTIRVPLEAVDDADARVRATQRLNELCEDERSQNELDCRLQRLWRDRPPEGVKL